MKRTLILTMLLLICCPSFSQPKGLKLLQKLVKVQQKSLEAKTSDLLIGKAIPTSAGRSIQVSFWEPKVRLQQQTAQVSETSKTPSQGFSLKTRAIEASQVISRTIDVSPPPQGCHPLDPNIYLIKNNWQTIYFRQPITHNQAVPAPPHNQKPLALDFQPTSLCPQKGLSEFKIHKDRLHPKDDPLNNNDCMDDPFSAFCPNISPNAITIAKTEQGFLINNKPSDNPSDDLVEVLSKSEISTFAEIIFDNTIDYSSILDLDKIEQNTNLDIQNCIASYYQNGSVLVQIPILSKSLLKTSFWEKFKRLFKKDKGNIEKEFKEIHYLENNIKTLHHDYILEDAAAA